MRRLQTVILFHASPQGDHHDWLLEDPTLPDDAPLWTARVLPAPDRWLTLQAFDIQPIAPHRRHYLTYQGPVSGDRGHVTRVAQGWFSATLWSPERKQIELHLGGLELGATITTASTGATRVDVASLKEWEAGPKGPR